VQAMPGFALLFIEAQVSGAPDAERCSLLYQGKIFLTSALAVRSRFPSVSPAGRPPFNRAYSGAISRTIPTVFSVANGLPRLRCRLSRWLCHWPCPGVSAAHGRLTTVAAAG